MPQDGIILGLPGYEITKMYGRGVISVEARHVGPQRCPECGSEQLRNKGKFVRKVRHENHGTRKCLLYLQAHKYRCQHCGRYFNERFPGIRPWRRSSEAFRRELFRDHHDGICRKTLAEREGLGTATVERVYLEHLRLKAAEMKAEPCPQVLGIDEQFFTRRLGYATTFCDLKNRKVYDVVLGRSETALDGYFRRLRGKENVQVVCIDLAQNYRRLIRRHFPNAKIVADRFHVIRIVNHHFLAAWRELDPKGRYNRGLLSLVRRHEENLKPEQKLRLQAYLAELPAFGAIYEFKQRLCRLLRKRSATARTCRRWIRRLLSYIHQLRTCGIEQLQTLGTTLGSWDGEIAAMWRFTKNNSITEGFHNKMEMLRRRAFGFRNFQNYRLRVRVSCA